MNHLNNLSLAGIVSTHPNAAIVFEKYQLDFCCGGKRTLQDALRNDFEKLALIKKELSIIFSENENSDQIVYDNLSLSALIDHIIQKHHHYIKEHLQPICNHLKRISDKHGEKHPELHQVLELFEELKDEIEQHLKKEELILFPRIKRIEAAFHNKNKDVAAIQIESPINIMEAEHETVHLLIEEIKKITNNYTPPKDACTTFKLGFDELENFEKDLHVHIHLENNILFPKALSMQNSCL